MKYNTLRPTPQRERQLNVRERWTSARRITSTMKVDWWSSRADHEKNPMVPSVRHDEPYLLGTNRILENKLSEFVQCALCHISVDIPSCMVAEPVILDCWWRVVPVTLDTFWIHIANLAVIKRDELEYRIQEARSRCAVRPTAKVVDERLDLIQLQQKSSNLHDETTAYDLVQHALCRAVV